MRVLLALAAVSLALAGCAKPQAAIITEPTVLLVPSPPPRVIVPPEPPGSDEIPVVDEVDKDEPKPARRQPARPDPKATVPPKPGDMPPATVEPPPSPVPQPPVTLQPVLPTSPQEVEAAVNEQIKRAKGDLDRVPYDRLSADAKAQYDMATRFMAQARQALTERNLVFAGKLAEKAGTIAAVLAGR